MNCQYCGLNPNEQQSKEQQKWEREFIEENGICNACFNESVNKCVYCGEWFTVGETGNELGFCESCINDPEFPYDIEAYYKDYDNGKVAFKGFDTMSRGILERYRK